mgnify:CR=1 FL=1
MKLPRWEAPRSTKQGVWKEIKEGYGYLRNNRRIFSIVSLSYIRCARGRALFAIHPDVRDQYLACRTNRVRASNVPLREPAPSFRLCRSPPRGAFRPGIFWICCCVTGFGLFLGLFTFSHSFFLSLVFLALVGGCQSRRSRRFEYRDSSGNAAAFARPSSESVLHGHRIMVAWRARDRQRCRDHRHRPHAGSVRRHMYHRGHRTAVGVKPKSPKITSGNLAQDVVRA